MHMHPNIERCLPHLNRFAISLSWNELTPNYHDADGLDVVWYTSGKNDGDESDLFLQINEHPIGCTAKFVGADYAIEHELWTGWHRFSFPDTDDEHRNAISLIDGWLNHKWFADEELVLQFSSLHPECTGFDWKRIREDSPPHEP